MAISYNELKQIVESHGFCIEVFDDKMDIQVLYLYIPDEGDYWSTSRFYPSNAEKTFATATFKFDKFEKMSIYKNLVINNAENKIYFNEIVGYEVLPNKITVDLLNELCETIKTKFKHAKKVLKLNKIEEDFE